MRPVGDTADFFLANTGTVITGNIIHIEDIFGGIDPEKGPLAIEITIEGITNPNSAMPAGDLIITTLLGEYFVDTGRSDGTFTPIAGKIQGNPIIIDIPITSG